MSEFFIEDRRRSRAYFTMLNSLKESAKQELEKMWRQTRGNMSRQNWEKLRMHLYDVQLDVFKQTYGRDIFAVEQLWAEWVKEEYDKLLKKKPRAALSPWHLAPRPPRPPCAQ